MWEKRKRKRSSWKASDIMRLLTCAGHEEVWTWLKHTSDRINLLQPWLPFMSGTSITKGSASPPTTNTSSKATSWAELCLRLLTGFKPIFTWQIQLSKRVLRRLTAEMFLLWKGSSKAVTHSYQFQETCLKRLRKAVQKTTNTPPPLHKFRVSSQSGLI